MSAMDRGGKRTVESCVALDIRHRPKQERIGPPLPDLEETITFPYTGRLHTITVTWTPCGKGWRTWLLCPSCAARRAVLYLRDGVLRCRCCWNLQYTTQAVTQEERQRLKFVRWRGHQGLSGSLKEPFRPRRKGEHRNHYFWQSIRDMHLHANATEAWIKEASGFLRR